MRRLLVVHLEKDEEKENEKIKEEKHSKNSI